MKISTAEILCVGTELLIGDIVNTNAAYISRKLAEMGISQYHQGVVGDNPTRLREAVSESLSRSDLVILSGGLGPTYDDLTKETVAELMGKKLILSEEILGSISEYFKNTCRTMHHNNEKQAYIPEGAVVFKNENGTAPGVAIEDAERGKIAIMLPGPPRELEPMFENKVMPYLNKFTDTVLVSRNINIFGMGESEVETKLHGLMENAVNPTVAPYVGTGEVRLRVTARGKNESECLDMCNEMIEKIKGTEIGAHIYGIDAVSLEAALLEILKAKKLTLATAESCTGGLVGKRITDVPGASAVYLGGVIAYDNRVKEAVLGVPGEVIKTYGAVSPECAVCMAREVRKLLGADIAVSTTGFAGPDGGEGGKPAGLVYVGISSKDGESVRKLMLAPGRKARDYVRVLAASNALSDARKAALKL